MSGAHVDELADEGTDFAEIPGDAELVFFEEHLEAADQVLFGDVPDAASVVLALAGGDDVTTGASSQGS